MPSVTTSALIQPVLKPAPRETPFGAVVARQLSVWPFAARTARLLVLIDPSLSDERLRQGLLRAMQQAYFASDGYSQTRAVSEAALAAHYVLQHHNRDVLLPNHVNAASAVAAVRGGVAFVALAGNATAYAFRNGKLTSQSGAPRVSRPLGTEQEPAITLWRTPLDPADRLVLICGAHCRPDAAEVIRDVLSSTGSASEAQHRLAEGLGDGAPAGVLVIASKAHTERVPYLRLVSQREETVRSDTAMPAPRRSSPEMAARRLAFPLLGIVLLALVTIATLIIAPQPNTLAAHAESVTPRTAVQLGASATNVVDMAAGDRALYTLDAVEGTVRAFALDGLDHQPTPETLVAGVGTAVDAGLTLGTPVAIQYLPSGLAIVDAERNVVQMTADATWQSRSIPMSADWRSLGSLGVGPAGELLFLDSAAHELLAYPSLDQEPPRVVFDAATSSVPFERVAQVVDTPESLLMRLDDGSVHRLDPTGADQPLALELADTPLAGISAIAPDRTGGLFVADPLNARVLQTRVDGTVLRELRAPALAGVRAIDVSLDGQRLFALVASGIEVVDIPSV